MLLASYTFVTHELLLIDTILLNIYFPFVARHYASAVVSESLNFLHTLYAQRLIHEIVSMDSRSKS